MQPYEPWGPSDQGKIVVLEVSRKAVMGALCHGYEAWWGLNCVWPALHASANLEGRRRV